MGNIFLTVVNMSITAAMAACAVCVIRMLLKKAPKGISYAMWAIVLFRAVCPVSFSSLFSFLGSMDNIGPATPGGTAGGGLQAAVSAAGPSLPETLLTAGAVIWITGVIAMIAYSVISYMLLKRKISTATLVHGNIYESDRIASPFVCGLIRPKIYLPVSLAEENRRYVLAHEQTHIRRRDYLIKPLAFLVLAVHWFNPLMWAAYLLMSRDIEMSCDERVIKALGSEIKTDYSHALLTLATNCRAICGTSLAFSGSNARARIRNVLSYKRPAFWIMMAAVAVCAAVGFCFLEPPPAEIVFNDPALEAAVREELGIKGRPVTTADAQAVTKLDLWRDDISNIDDLAYFTALTYLDLGYGGKIEDISALVGLTNLTTLELSGNEIEDITALADLTSLTYLNLAYNKIEDISALVGLTNLTTLELSGNEIEDITALADLTSLTYLNLAYNKIEDISALVGLTNLTTLELSGNEIEDITALADLTSLTYLNLTYNKIEDISALAGLTNLTFLFLEETETEDISALAGLTNLTYLYLRQNNIEDISALTGLTNLSELDLSYNKIEDTPVMEGLTNLTLLDLHQNQIEDISGLAGLINLNNLDLSYNKIEDISALAGLTNLNYLHLHANQIEDISALAGLTNLWSVILEDNPIKDFSPLEAYYDQLGGSDFTLDPQQ